MREPVDPKDIDEALRGDRRAMQALVKVLRPAIQAEVGFALLRAARSEHRDPRQEALDMVQDVFASLLASNGKILRSWEPQRGSSLPSFVRLVARRHVASVLRSKRRNPYREASASDTLGARKSEGDGPEAQAELRERLARTWEVLEARLDERSLLLFDLLYVQERSIPEVMEITGMTRDAIYAWRSRVRRNVIDPLRGGADDEASDPPDSRPIIKENRT